MDGAVPMQKSLYHWLEVAELIEESHDSRSIVFAPPEQQDAFSYKPGQFLTLRIPGQHMQPVVRCYSLASAPMIDAAMKVTVKRVAGGIGSNWICDHLKAGDRIEVLPPAGIFCPKSLDVDFLLFAGGSGITPVMSILKSCLHRGQGKITLFYANRDERSVIFADELRALAAEYPERLLVIHWLETLQGRPSREQLLHLSRNQRFDEVFVCGPEPFMDAVEASMKDLGINRSHVHVERFLSLDGDPGMVDDIPLVVPLDDADTVMLDVQLDGEHHELRWSPDSILLDTLQANAIMAPFSCREGRCSACMCRLLEGTVEMEHNQILEPSDLEEGWVLACQARPTSEKVSISFDE